MPVDLQQRRAARSRARPAYAFGSSTTTALAVGRRGGRTCRGSGPRRCRRPRRAPPRPRRTPAPRTRRSAVVTISSCGSCSWRSSRGIEASQRASGPGSALGAERQMELVVQRPDPVACGDGLAEIREAAAVPRERRSALRANLRQLEPAQAAGAGAEHGHEPAREQRAQHLVEVIVERRRRSDDESALLPQDRAVQALQLRSRLQAELFDERPTCGAVGLERIRLPARTVERQHQLRPEALPERVRARRAPPAPATSAASAPASRSAAIRSSSAPRRSSSSRRASLLGEGLERDVGKGPPSPERERLAEDRCPRAPARPSAPRPRAARTGPGRTPFPPGRAGTRWVECASTPGPSSFRSWEIAFCRDVVAVRGGCSPQSWSMSRSADTASLARKRSRVSTARWLRPPSGMARPVLEDFERTEDFELQHASVVTEATEA